MAWAVKMECSECLESFNGLEAFDKHRSGLSQARHCLSVPEMVTRGFKRGLFDRWDAPTRGSPPP